MSNGKADIPPESSVTGDTEKTIRLGVTDLVSFAAREGDLHVEDSSGPNAQEGLRGHQQLQKSRSAPWESEKVFSAVFLVGDYTVQLNGRADLFNAETTPTIIEEIKTCYGAGHLREDSRSVLYWAQLKVYSALYFSCLADDVPAEIQLRLTHYDLDSRQIFQEQESISREQAVEYCTRLLQKYCQWWTLVERRRKHNRDFLQQLDFPFEQYRPGQRETAVAVFRQLRDGQSLLLEAPTGTGKTLSVLFPALKAYAHANINQLLYLTPKGSAQLNAVTALKLLGVDAELDGLVLQSKEKACDCLHQNNEDEPIDTKGNAVCALTLGFYDRLPEAREAALQSGFLDAEGVKQLAQQYRLCPFAFAVHLIPWFSLVIADVNYFFDPLVQLSCFASHCKQRAVLIDEVHNLPARARDMFSAVLDSMALKAALACLPASSAALKKSMQQLLNSLKALEVVADIAETSRKNPIPASINRAVQQVFNALHKDAGTQGFAGPAALRSWLKDLYRFAAIAQLQSNSHRVFVEALQQERALKLRCLDGSALLAQNYQKAHSVIGFSATLQPADFSVQQLGLGSDTPMLCLPSWFPERNQLHLCCQFIATDWRQREQSLPQLIALIHSVTQRRAGNYFVFFPSYAYLQLAWDCYRQQYPDDELLVQAADMLDEQRETFIQRFRQAQPVLAFGVLGGVFAEGVDYCGDMLVGAIIVGTGMPQPNSEQQSVANLYRQQGLNAYQYAYQFPGFVRLRQAAGRVIRSPTDRGVIIFVEPRLQRADYRQLYPPHWHMHYCKNQDQIDLALKQFWQPDEGKPSCAED